MKRVYPVSTVIVDRGFVRLNKTQINGREYCLRSTDVKDVYRVVKPIEFKSGDGFHFDESRPVNAVSKS